MTAPRASLVALAALALARTASADPAPAPVTHVPPTIELRVHGEAIAGAVVTSIAGTSDRRFTLDRAELGAELVVGHRATGELVIEAVRSAARNSAAGIDGNSLLARIKRAALGGRGELAHHVALAGALGLVGDPWITALGDFPLRALGVSVVEDQGLIASSDLGVSATVGVGEVARLQVAITNGDGAHQLERNQGKDTSAVLTLRSPRAALGVGSLALHLYGRDGSIGPASIRSHRAGAALVWHHPRAAAGADLVRAWGVGEHADVTAWTAEAWADLRLHPDLGATLRWDRVALTGPAGAADPPDRSRVTTGLWLELAGTVRVVAAVQLERAGAGAAIADVPTATDATRFMILAQGSFATTP